MSTSAGRVMPIPKGAYDSATTYHVLDIVTYNGSSYICKATTTGNIPTNTTYWQLNASGSAVSSLDEIGDVDITSVTNGQVLKYNSSASKWENGDAEGGGLLPHIIVISESGSTVSAVKGGTTISFTETSSGHFEGDVDEFGTWTIHAVLSGDDATVSLVVDTVKVYTVDDSHFHADITAYYPKDAGATCALSASGQATQYATTNPYVFTVHEAGTYTLTVTYDGQTYTDTVSVTTTGQTFTKYVPSASNAPANDYQMWLFFGGIDNSESTYTSLADILADSSALATLMSTNVAVDYLVRCKEWAGVGLVPTMTSDTTPSGEASASTYISDYLAWKAFDRNSATKWCASSSFGQPCSLTYKFATAKTVRKAKVLIDVITDITTTMKYQGSNDGTNWTDLTESFTFSGTSNEKEFSTVGNYLYYRAYISTQTTISGPYTIGGQIVELQFFSTADATDITTSQSAMQYIGLNNYCANTLLSDSDWLSAICNSTYFESVLNVKVPTMTSNTTPSGEASASGVYSSTYPAWNAFDGIYPPATATAWVSPATNDTVWIKYRFSGKQVRICAMMVYPTAAPSTLRVKTFTLKGSNDDSAYTELFTHQFPQDNTLVKENYFGFVQANSYEYFKVELPDFWGPNQRGFIELQLYGREDV